MRSGLCSPWQLSEAAPKSSSWQEVNTSKWLERQPAEDCVIVQPCRHLSVSCAPGAAGPPPHFPFWKNPTWVGRLGGSAVLPAGGEWHASPRPAVLPTGPAHPPDCPAWPQNLAPWDQAPACSVHGAEKEDSVLCLHNVDSSSGDVLRCILPETSVERVLEMCGTSNVSLLVEI